MATRRQILRAALVASAFSVPTVASAAMGLICIPNGTSAEWVAALERMKATQAVAHAYYTQTYEPAYDASRRQRREQEAELQARIDAIPHYTTTRTYETDRGLNVAMTTAKPLHVRLALDFVGTNDPTDDFVECCHELFKAVSQRLRQEQEIRDRFIFEVEGEVPPVIKAEHEWLSDISHAAFRAVCHFQPRNPADLIAKVEFLKEQETDIDPDDMLADLRALFGEARP